ncbi:hypothetical protein D3227_20060 [Mesorhizobium waimense]|uniref:SD-repeat containing protein B domain-containing protein n=1 Tax=Mesorhizobium waimense TaxID=1300307 RepID=A0A3A5KTB3_9HYPH|nr:hypothetical protein [Mesorhizobium waimense]RJT36450.1 hypothetical protein D3227_20060 [Mesorhizobium waimense]
MLDIGLTAIFIASGLVLAAAALLALLLRQARDRKIARRRANPANDYAVRTRWGPSTTSTLNFSSFVYMDVDGDGKYGLADRPIAGIMVRLFDERGVFVKAARSNNGGFANFTMSTKRRRTALRAPGLYRFSVSVPPGWRASGANENQSIRLHAAPESLVGLAGDGLPTPVGLVPGRHLAGRMQAAAQATLTVMGNEGEVLESRTLAPGTSFRVDLAGGADAVEISGGGLDRRLALSSYPTDLGLLSPGSVAPDAALRAIGFDDVTKRSLRKVPCGHAGLDWRNLNAMSRDNTRDSEGYVNGNVSGDHIAYTSSGHPAEFGRDRPFGFHSVMLTAAWLACEGEIALVESWLGEELLRSDEIVLSALTPCHYAPLLNAVTRVRLSTRHHWQLVVDDLVLVF